MKQIIVILFLMFVLFFQHSKAQEVVATTEQLIADIFEQYTAENETETIDYETFYEELINLSKSPINLNFATQTDLEHLPFLSDIQIENILSYIFRFGQMYSIYELQLIEGLDMTDIRRLLPFVFISNVELSSPKIYWNDLVVNANNELYFRMDAGLDTKKGYKTNDEQTKVYNGNRIYNTLKYRYSYKDRVYWGLTGEKDAGESFNYRTNGYDFYSVHLQLKNFGKFKNVVVGDFRANYGMGLVLHPDFGMGKSSYVLNVTSRNQGLKKYSSTDEYNFFRGVGTTIRIKKIDFTAFYSLKKVDGDTVNNTFTSIYRTGYHRTLDELSKRKTVLQNVIGGNLNYSNNFLQLGLTVVNTVFDNLLLPNKSTYNYFYFTGKKQTTAGINYRLRWNKLIFFGETAAMTNNGFAIINGFSFSPTSTVSLVALQRHFTPSFDNLYANTFSESTRVNNEKGIYLGAEIRPYKKWKVSVYADSYQFVWPKFGVDAPTNGKDFLVQADFNPRRDLNMYWRLKYENKPINMSEYEGVMPQLVDSKKASLKYQLSYSYLNFNFKNVIDANFVQQSEMPSTYGFSVLQDISYNFQYLPLRIDCRFQFFDAENYQNRFYSYEKDVLYAFSIPMYYGLGSRYYLNLKYELSNKLSVWFKCGHTVFADNRETIGTGNETIEGNRKTDVRLLLKLDL